MRAADRRDEQFQGLLLQHRGRTGLTQREVASRAHVHVRSVQAWEGGVSYPGAASLKALIVVFLEASGFNAEREGAEAEALWAAAVREAPRLLPPFDTAWFATLLGDGHQTSPGVVVEADPSIAAPRSQDWGDAPDVLGFLGRVKELATLKEWVLDERCRLVALLGMGGIGKTTLAARFARELAPAFERVYWRSVRNAPSFMEWSEGAIGFLSDQQRLSPPGESARFGLLLELLRERRCLLVLDNLELLLQPGASDGGYRPGYEGYGTLVQVLAESDHQSCLLLTSREAPPELAHVGERPRVQALELGGLDVAEAQSLLSDKRLVGDATAWTSLVARYGGNSLALKVVGDTIHQVFGGEIATFMDQAVAGTIFGGIRRLIDGQVERLSPLERQVLQSLAVEREAVGFGSLVTDPGVGVGRAAVLEALEALRRRSLVERTEPGSGFTLPSVVLEYVTDQLIERAADEFDRGQLALLHSRPLVKAQAKDYVRRSQERLIAEPILERVVARSGGRRAAEQRLLALLDHLRDRPTEEQGYGPGNLVNLLRLLRGDLRGADLSGLHLRQAFLQEVDAQDASLARAHLSEAVIADAFSYPTCVALSADGAYLAAGTTTGEVCLWRVTDRTLVATLRGHQGLVSDVALSSDGLLVASSSEDGTVRVWAASGTPVLVTTGGQAGGVRGVALSGDGRLVASGSQEGTVQVWDAHSGSVRTTMRGHLSGVRGVALSQDGSRLASASVDGTVRLWETASGRLLSTLEGHTGAAWSVALSADGALVASASVDQTVRLWETAHGQPLATLVGHTGGVWSVALSSDGRLVASGSFDGTIRLWSFDTLRMSGQGQVLATLQGHTAGVRDVALSGSGHLVASCSYDGTIRLWQTQNGRMLATLRGHTSGVRGVALSGDGQLVASGSYDGTVRLWDVATGQPLRRLGGHTGGVWSVALSDDARLVASGSFDGTIKLWETGTGRLLTTLQGQINEVWGVALKRGRSPGRQWQLQRNDARVGGAEWSIAGDDPGPHGRRVGRGAGWRTPHGGQRRRRRDRQAVGCRKRDLLTTLKGHTGGVWSVALSGDGHSVASAGEDGSVKVWETDSGRLLATLEGHTGGVWSVALSDDGQRVASGSFDGLVRLWEARTGQLLATLEGHTGAVWSVALSGDRTLVASGSFDGTLRLWDARDGTWLRTLRADRRYERLDISGLTGVSDAQHEALLALGAVDHALAAN